MGMKVLRLNLENFGRDLHIFFFVGQSSSDRTTQTNMAMVKTCLVCSSDKKHHLRLIVNNETFISHIPLFKDALGVCIPDTTVADHRVCEACIKRMQEVPVMTT